jgi:penicillin-binding protein 1C
VITPSTILDDLAHTADGIGNADARFLGPLLPRKALANSRNVPAVELSVALGLDDTYGLFRDLGLHDGTLPAGHYGSGLAIGGMPTTAIALAGAYTTLAGDGIRQQLRWYDRQPKEDGRRILTEDATRHVTTWLSDPMARLPTFPRMGHTEYPFPVAVKTGTSGDWRDAWTVAYSPSYLVVVWVGHPDWTPMNGLSGYRAASRVARDILIPLHAGEADGLADAAFSTPADHVPVSVCPMSGAKAADACDGATIEHFSVAAVPEQPCTVHIRQNKRTVVDMAPRYAAWADSQGLERVVHPHLSDEVPNLRILSPRHGEHVLRDPETPHATLLLKVAVAGPAEQVVWYVDGEPFAVTDWPYTARWPLSPGSHRFEARVLYTTYRSPEVRIATR